MVLFKGFFDSGLSFYTSYEGRKGLELEARPFAAATFWWDRLERQVRFEGRVARLPRDVRSFECQAEMLRRNFDL